MEPPRTNMLPCSQSEHNAQAPQVSTVTLVSTRVFPNDRGEAHCGYRSAPLCHRRNIIIAPPQRVLWVDETFLPVAGFCCATGQIRASGAIAEAHLDVRSMYTAKTRRLSVNTAALQ